MPSVSGLRFALFSYLKLSLQTILVGNDAVIKQTTFSRGNSFATPPADGPNLSALAYCHFHYTVLLALRWLENKVLSVWYQQQ
jgi:hypothetical protein